jgi:hypothetical protein
MNDIRIAGGICVQGWLWAAGITRVRPLTVSMTLKQIVGHADTDAIRDTERSSRKAQRDTTSAARHPRLSGVKLPVTVVLPIIRHISSILTSGPDLIQEPSHIAKALAEWFY